MPIAAVGYGMASVPETHPAARRRGTEFREAALSTLIGVGVVFLVFFARTELFGWRMALYGALCGLSVYLCCRAVIALVGFITTCPIKPSVIYRRSPRSSPK
jgi:hypothetical protein